MATGGLSWLRRPRRSDWCWPLLGHDLFGWGGWQAFLTAAAGAGSVYAQRGALDRGGADEPVRPDPGTGRRARRGHGGAGGGRRGDGGRGAAGCGGVACRCRLRAAVLLAAIPIAVPIVMFYDLLLSGVAVAWLVRGGWERGFPPWQASTFPVLFALALLAGNIGPVQLLMPPVTPPRWHSLWRCGGHWHDRGEVAAATLRLVVGDALCQCGWHACNQVPDPGRPMKIPNGTRCVGARDRGAPRLLAAGRAVAA